MFWEAKTLESGAICKGVSFIKWRYSSLFQQPRDFICDSVSPADSAEVAALMQKLCVLYDFVSSPTSCKTDNKFVLNAD